MADILGQIANPQLADIAGAISYRKAQMDKDEERRNAIITKKLMGQALSSGLQEGTPMYMLANENPQAYIGVAKTMGIDPADGSGMHQVAIDAGHISQLMNADDTGSLAAQYMQTEAERRSKLGLNTSYLQKGLDSLQQNPNTFKNAVTMAANALNPKAPDYKMMEIRNEQAKIAQADKFKSADLAIEQQKLALEREKSKQSDTGITYQQDENGNLVALPTKLQDGGSLISTPVIDAKGNQIKGKGQPLTESQSNAALFAARAKESQKIINDIGTDYNVIGLNAKKSVDWIPMVGAAANAMLSDKQQSVEQAQRDFINAVLRKESGASITPSEFQNAQKQYFPQTGDSEAVIKQKNENRKTAIAGLEIASGNGSKMVEAKQNEGKSKPQSAADRLKALTGGK